MLENLGAAVGHEQDRCSVGFEFLQVGITFFLEHLITHGQGFIHDEQIRLNMGLNRKSQANGHAARIGLHRLINEVADVGKAEDGIETGLNFRLCET